MGCAPSNNRVDQQRSDTKSKPVGREEEKSEVKPPQPIEEEDIPLVVVVRPTIVTQGDCPKKTEEAPVLPSEEEMDGPVTASEKKTVAEKAGLTPEVLAFDSAFALEQVDDDVEFLVELKTSVTDLQKETDLELPASLKEKDWKAMFEKAHGLKGAVANLGMERLRLLGLSLEQTGRILHSKEGESQYSEREIAVLLELVQDEWTLFNETFDAEIEKLQA